MKGALLKNHLKCIYVVLFVHNSTKELYSLKKPNKKSHGEGHSLATPQIYS